MAAPKSTVKSSARSERAKATMAALPRDPTTGRIQKRAAAAGDPPAGVKAAPEGGTGVSAAAANPFGQGRGLRRFRRQTSG